MHNPLLFRSKRAGFEKRRCEKKYNKKAYLKDEGSFIQSALTAQ